jgi:hypothetical protein
MEYTFEKEGVRLNGNFVKYDSPIENIPPTVIDKLNMQTANAWSLFLIHKSILNQTKELKEELKKHLICPINPDGIKKIARTEAEAVVSEQPKKIRNKVIPFLKDILLILSVATMIVTLLTK